MTTDKQNVIKNKESEIKHEFEECLLMDSTVNTNLDIVKYWIAMQSSLTNLNHIALTYLCFSCGICAVERYFTKLRNIQTKR